MQWIGAKSIDNLVENEIANILLNYWCSVPSVCAFLSRVLGGIGGPKMGKITRISYDRAGEGTGHPGLSLGRLKSKAK